MSKWVKAKGYDEYINLDHVVNVSCNNGRWFVNLDVDCEYSTKVIESREFPNGETCPVVYGMKSVFVDASI